MTAQDGAAFAASMRFRAKRAGLVVLDYDTAHSHRHFSVEDPYGPDHMLNIRVYTEDHATRVACRLMRGRVEDTPLDREEFALTLLAWCFTNERRMK